MSYDALVISALPDDAESQMGGTLAKLSDQGQRILLVDLTDGEPTEFAEPGVHARRADEAARILGVERMTLDFQDRLLADTLEARLRVARLIREHRPGFVYGTGEACVHPDHAAMVGLTRAAVFLARLGQWKRVPGGEMLAGQEPWIVERLFFPHCKMEPPWGEFAFAVDVSAVYERKRQACLPTSSSSALREIVCLPSTKPRISITGACWACPTRRFFGAPPRCSLTLPYPREKHCDGHVMPPLARHGRDGIHWIAGIVYGE